MWTRQISRFICFPSTLTQLTGTTTTTTATTAFANAIKSVYISSTLPHLSSHHRVRLSYHRMAGQRDIFAMLASRGKKKEEAKEVEVKKFEVQPKKTNEESVDEKSIEEKIEAEDIHTKRKRPVIEDDEEEVPAKSQKSEVKSPKKSKSAIKATATTTAESKEADVSFKSDSDEPQSDYDEIASDVEIEKKEAISLAKLDSLKPSIDLSTKLTPGKPIPYAAVVEVFAQIESTTKRLEIIKYTADFFLAVLRTNPQDLIYVTYLFINRLGPDYEGLELGLGETILIKTITEATGKSTAQVKAKYRETGDLGEIALKARSTQPTMFKPKALTVTEVFKNLKEIAKTSGTSSQTKKINIIKRMLTAAQGLEAKFIIRSLESKLRIGLAEKTVLIGLARALAIFQSSSKSSGNVPIDTIVKAEDLIRDAFCQVPNYEVIIDEALQHGVLNLDKHCTLKPGIPLKPMLAKPTKSITEVLDKFTGEEFTCEYKYDGERAQVHLLNDGTVKVYSRNSEDMSQRYPDIIDAVQGFLNPQIETKSLIIDCEAVAWSREENKILPFQVLTTRKRKDVELKDIKVHVCLFAFDVLCLNDEPTISKPLKERRQILHSVLREIPGKFQFATAKNTTDVDELQAFLDVSIKNSCEGLMVKTLNNDPYRPSQRSNSWLKLKKDYLSGVGDSLDLIVIGAYYGKGKRTGTYGGFLLGCYNQDTEEIETCCKIGTGFSDEVLKQLYEKLQPTEIDVAKSDIIYDPSAEPDVWFEPSLLFEVLTADLSLSPIYKAGVAVLGKGVSLRFPRFLRLRDDKGIEDATSSDQVVEFYERQAHQQG